MREKESPNVQVLNIPELLAQLGDDRALLGELLEIFKEECPPLLRSLAEAVSSKDARVVERTSHNLKGMLSTLSAPRASSAASQLEQMGRTGEMSGCRGTLTILEAEVVSLLVELENCLETAEQ
jgi:HPt (histidine-containing phosphotransfer) domain-containing protein